MGLAGSAGTRRASRTEAPGTRRHQAGSRDDSLRNAPTAAGVAPGLVGRKIQNSPEYTNTLGIDFNRGIGPRYSLQAHVDWKLIGPLYFDSFNTDFARRDEVNLVDGRLALRRDAEQGTSWQVSLWGRNLFDERYNEYAAPVIGIANYTYRGAMRSYGVDFTVQF